MFFSELRVTDIDALLTMQFERRKKTHTKIRIDKPWIVISLGTFIHNICQSERFERIKYDEFEYERIIQFTIFVPTESSSIQLRLSTKP